MKKRLESLNNSVSKFNWKLIAGVLACICIVLSIVVFNINKSTRNEDLMNSLRVISAELDQAKYKYQMSLMKNKAQTIKFRFKIDSIKSEEEIKIKKIGKINEKISTLTSIATISMADSILRARGIRK